MVLNVIASTGGQAERLRRRTRTAFAVVLIAFLGVGAGMTGALVTLDRIVSGVLKNDGESMRLLLRLQRDRATMLSLAGQALREVPPPAAGRRIDDLAAVMEGEGRQFQQLTQDPTRLAAWNADAADRAAFDRAVRTALDRAAARDMARAQAAYDAALDLDRELDDRSEELVRGDARRVRRLMDALDRRLALTLFFNLLAVALGSLGAIVLVRQALAALREYSRETQARLEDLDLFAARVAHDLRQPLSALSLLLGAAERAASEEASIRAALSRGIQTVRRLDGMLEDLLAFSRAGVPGSAGSGAALAPIVAEIIAELDRGEQAAGIEWRLSIEEGVRVAVEPGNVRSIIWNLLENAVKYLPAEGERRVSVCASVDPPGVRMIVRDTGPGIPGEALERIFQPFRRATSAGLGYGLGLATVKRLVEAHGGRIAVESAVGRGAAFTVELPQATS
jgi:signal transduction histidine kinase